MAAMLVVRRTLGVFLLAVVALAVAAPLEAMRCATKSACPMMANRIQPCHTGDDFRPGELTAPMSCCRTEATQATAPSVPAFESVAGVLPRVAAWSAVPVLPAASTEFRANRQVLGLFTLLAVWRI